MSETPRSGSETPRSGSETPNEASAPSSQGNPWKRRRGRSRSSLFAAGEPMVWLTGGALVICGLMVVGLLSLVLYKGAETFWPVPLVQVETEDGRTYMGEITRHETYRPEQTAIDGLEPELAQKAISARDADEGWLRRQLVRTGNYRLTQSHFRWVDDFEIAQRTYPEWGMVVERMEWGRFYGIPQAFLELTPVDGQPLAEVVAEVRRRSQGDIRILDTQRVDGLSQPVLVSVDEMVNVVSPQAVAVVYDGPEAAWKQFQEHHKEVRSRLHQRQDLEKFDTGEINHRKEAARLEVRGLEMELTQRIDKGQPTDALEAQLKEAQAQQEETDAWANQEFQRVQAEIEDINLSNRRYQLLMATAGEGDQPGQNTLLRLDDIVHAYPANRLDFGDKMSVYLDRWAEFLTDEPREANAEGGVYPAIFGTVMMTLIMSLLVVPFGVLAALYLREYAKAGPLVSAVRIAVNNLAGVPSIVFGVFGLGFFCYVTGATIDQLFFASQLPSPTFGKGGLLWASFTLALLTLPVVIVATEEAVSAVPNSMREGSYACGASKWQTIQRIVLPRALPGIITGMILAIARGAGEVAPLMLVGAVKLAPELVVDGTFPYFHPQRSFMHLGFHIFDVGFQSPNAEAAKPMVFTTTLLLISLVATLNFAAVWLRNHLRKRFAGGQF